ncbi:GNAT family N-acetyltransferase [Sphingobacterium sp. SRCM116780]|uniref:GNAT family N-acetyltransferase n=1 Tax=Sphingobacterium sp. SRCM116780 TaxID=2907623 RepID=UPI001F423576|nr:GNAT family N-acetyltransferase [Sphingobacterium sp. SRCM116780]UIR55713.1 GNAT family N-acetyltransferase [Sphingobacterium sp. SRCM116780]
MSAITIQLAEPKEAIVISEIGKASYHATYPAILTEEQINFMLAKNYTVEAIHELMHSGQDFYVLYEDLVAKGFIAVQMKENSILRIEKLYLLPEVKGKGYGKTLIDFSAELAISTGLTHLELNVNRGNPAYHFYLKQGFLVTESVDIPYYGYILDDYVMQKDVLL